VDGSILTALLFVTVFYQGYFQSPGVAEADLEHDVRFTVRTFLYDGSGDAPRPAVKEDPAKRTRNLELPSCRVCQYRRQRPSLPEAFLSTCRA
jgi:hypothetical protein